MRVVTNTGKLYLFLILLFFITTMNGVCMGVAVLLDRGVSTFGTIHMMIPATVTFLVFLLSSNKSACFPKHLCKVVFLADGLLILEVVAELFFLSPSQSEYLSACIFIFSVVLFYAALFWESREVKECYGLRNHSNGKSLLFYLVLFLVFQACTYLIQATFEYFTGNHYVFRYLLEGYRQLPLSIPGLFFGFFATYFPFLVKNMAGGGSSNHICKINLA